MKNVVGHGKERYLLLAWSMLMAMSGGNVGCSSDIGKNVMHRVSLRNSFSLQNVGRRLLERPTITISNNKINRNLALRTLTILNHFSGIDN